MSRIKQAVMGTAVLGLFVSTTGGTFAAARPAAARPAVARTAAKKNFTVNVTTTYYSWGTVKINFKHDQCGYTAKNKVNGSCHFAIPKNRKITVTEKALDKNVWPFTGWTYNKKHLGKKATIHIKVTAHATLTANYKEHIKK